MSNHSTLGPSQASRWIPCPGSVALAAKAPKPAPNYAAAEGTVAHEIAEKFVTGKIDTAQMMKLIGTVVKQEGLDIEIIEEMFDGAVEYRDLIADDLLAFELNPKHMKIEAHAELKVHAKSVDDRVWGTSDYVLFRKGDKLIVYDYKFGQGVIVDPEENEQLALYLIGVMDTLAGEVFSELEVVIHQPRGRHADGPVRRWTVKRDWLNKFRAEAKAAALETLNPNAKIVAGDHCRWCPAKPFCPEIHKAAQESAMVAFDAVAPEKPVKAEDRLEEVRLMPVEKLAKMLEWEGSVKALFEAVKDVIREKLSNGEIVPGWKLVEGRANRQWIDEALVIAEFAPSLGEAALYERKFLSPAKLEKVIGKKHKIDHLVYKPVGEKAVARDRDPRPAVASAAADAFDVIDTVPVCSECEIMGTCPKHEPKIAAVTKVTEPDLMDQLGAAPEKKREPLWPV